MGVTHITSVEWATLEGHRPRSAGCNARLGVHGGITRVPIVRVTDSDGMQGVGASWAKGEKAQRILGMELNQLFLSDQGVAEAWLDFDYPLWDLHCKRTGQPVYVAAAQVTGRTPITSFSAPCYDTSLYIDDLEQATDEAASQLMADEVRQGLARGHRAFKVKIGRGARHMPLAAGTARDIAVIRAVRETTGSQATLMLDANNGYNLNLAKDVLDATHDCDIFWLEEPFHEDGELYRDLKGWMVKRGLRTLIADGEGEASTRLLEWAHQGLVGAIQYDILGHGFTRWLRTGRQLDAWEVLSAPHHYGNGYGNYAACHLAAAIKHFAAVEWDETDIPGLSAPGYSIENGRCNVPPHAGFGIELDDDLFQHAVRSTGGRLSLGGNT